MTDRLLLRLRDGDVPPSPLVIDGSVLHGRWRNTETRWQWVREVEIGQRGIRIRGGSDPSPSDWGEAPIETFYTTAPDSAEVGGFSATFEHGAMTSTVQGIMNQGLMVLVVFNDADGAGRVTREFFAREGASA